MSEKGRPMPSEMAEKTVPQPEKSLEVFDIIRLSEAVKEAASGVVSLRKSFLRQPQQIAVHK